VAPGICGGARRLRVTVPQEITTAATSGTQKTKPAWQRCVRIQDLPPGKSLLPVPFWFMGLARLHVA
jgi:hypothetical protein